MRVNKETGAVEYDDTELLDAERRENEQLRDENRRLLRVILALAGQI